MSYLSVPITYSIYRNQHEELGNNFVAPITEKDIAIKMNMDVRTLQNYKKLTEMIPELEELVETGITTPDRKSVV